MAPEVWMRGAIDGIAPLLQPVAHSLLQVREELDAILPTLSAAQLAARPGDVASVGYHASHLVGSIDRLFTYARGEGLSEEQFAALRAESEGTTFDAESLLGEVRDRIDRALRELERWSANGDDLLAAREVGRKKFPSTVLGLLFHAAEHAQRHVGQIATTARLVRQLP